MLPDEPDDKPGSPPAESDDPKPSAGEASAPEPANEPIFALGENEQVPLAAVFKRRRGGATPGPRRSPPVDSIGEAVDSAVTEARSVTPAAGHGQGDYDVVLTDAFRVPAETGPASSSELPPVVAEPDVPVAAADAPAPRAPATPAPPPIVGQTPPPPPPPPVAPPPPSRAAVSSAADADDSIEIPDDTEPAARVGLPENAVDLDPALAVETILSLARKSASVRRTPTAGAWFAELFGNDYFLAHPQRLGPATTREVEFIEAALRMPNGGRVLDLCCGYGRHTVPLAAKGYELVGLDLSLDMLKAALGRAQANSLAIKFVHGDMRDLNFRDVFDGVYCFDSSFGFFTEPENLMVLRGVFDALKRGGRFVLDVANRDSAIRGIPTRNWWKATAASCRRTSSSTT